MLPGMNTSIHKNKETKRIATMNESVNESIHMSK